MASVTLVKSDAKCVPTVCLDYMYMHESPDKSEDKGMPILVARDANHDHVGTGMLFARVVPAKGVNQYAVKGLAHDVASLGYSELVL